MQYHIFLEFVRQYVQFIIEINIVFVRAAPPQRSLVFDKHPIIFEAMLPG